MENIKNIIVKKVLDDPLTDNESEIFEQWMNNPTNVRIYERLKTYELTEITLKMDDEGLGGEMVHKFRYSVQLIKRTKRKRIASKIAYAVSAAAIIAISFLLYNENDGPTNKMIAVQNRNLTSFHEIIEKDDSIKLITATEVLNLDKNREKESKGGSVIHGERNAISLNEVDSELVLKEPQIITLVVPIKREYNFILPDGSRVWLNSDSRLIFPNKFSATSRSVELIGEAYFEIVKNEKAPFIVKTDKINTRVLGTQFMISCYDDKNEVALVEGSVMVNKNGSSQNITLKPGRGVALNREAKELREIEISIEKILERKRGFLFFDEERLEDIVADLRRWYGVDFVFEDEELKNQTFYIKINRNDNIQYIMQLLKFTRKIDYSIDKNRVIIKPHAPMIK